MNAKKRKSLRRYAAQICEQTGVQSETVRLINTKTGVVRVGKCFRGVYRHMKNLVRKGQLSFARPTTPTPTSA